jgi:hypothetical protein
MKETVGSLGGICQPVLGGNLLETGTGQCYKGIEIYSYQTSSGMSSTMEVGVQVWSRYAIEVTRVGINLISK